MPIEVRGPDGQRYQFPDGTDDAVMLAALRNVYGGPADEPPAPKPISATSTQGITLIPDNQPDIPLATRTIPVDFSAIAPTVGVGEGLMMRARAGIGQAIGGAQQMFGEQVGSLVDTGMAPFQTFHEAVTGAKLPNPVGRGLADSAAEGAGVAEQARIESKEAQAGTAAPSSLAAAFGDPGNTLRYYGGLMAESAPMMAAAMATRNPAIATAAMGAGTAGQTYSTERAEGATPMQAAQQAFVSGGMESALGLVPFEKALGAGSLPRRMVTAGAAEAETEALTGGGQQIAGDAMKGKDTARRDINRAVIDSAIVGGGMGAGMAVLGSGRSDQPAENAGPPGGLMADAVRRQNFRDFERDLDDALTPTARPAPRTPAEAGAQAAEDALQQARARQPAATPAPAAAPLDAPLGDIPAESTTDLDAAIDAMLAPTTETAPDGRLGTSAPIAAPPVVGSGGIVDAATPTPDSVASAVEDAAPETGRRPFLTPDDVAREKFTARATEAGLSPEQIAQMTPDTLADDVTGFFDGRLKGVKSGTILRAQEHVESTGEPAFYVDGDIVNLGGLNKATGENMEAANAHYRAMTDILRAELESTGGDIVPLRTGGDEVGAVVVNAPESAIRAAMTAANAKVRAYAQANGFGDIPHTKADRTDRGVGLHLGLAPIQPGASLSDIIEASSAEIAASKGGTPDVNGSQTERLGPVAPVGPAGSVGGSVATEAQGAGGQDAARLGQAPSAQGDAQGVRAAPQVIPAEAPSAPTVTAPPPSARPAPKGRSTLAAIAKTIGLDLADFKRHGVDPANFRGSKGSMPGLFRKQGGMTLSRFREWAQENEYLPRDPENAPPTVSDDDALDLFYRLFANEEAVALGDVDANLQAKAEQDRKRAEDRLNADPAAAMQRQRARDIGNERALEALADFDNGLLTAPGLQKRLDDAETYDESAVPFSRAPANQPGLLDDATPQERVESERQRRDDQRNGKAGSGRTDMASGDGDLFAGNRPDQSSLFSRTDKPQGIALNTLSRVVRSLFSGWTNAPTVRAVQSVADVPADVRERARLSQSASPFYSAMARSVEAAQGAPKRADAGAWEGWLDGAQRRGEFKQSERDWLGVDAWLDGRGATTREELAEFVRANQVQVEDVVLGRDVLPTGAEPTITADQIEVIEDPDDDEFWTVDSPAGNRLVAKKHYPTKVTATDFALRYFNGQIKERNRERAAKAGVNPKYENYRTPGGENYRELLLTLPETTAEIGTSIPIGEWFASSDERFAYKKDGRVTPFAELTQAERTNVEAAYARAKPRRLPQGMSHVVAREAEAIARAKNFRSSHWDQPNVLAHVRFDERTDADGKRVLFINEIQSDWHQAGRKRGYRNVGPGAEAIASAQRSFDESAARGENAAVWRRENPDHAAVLQSEFRNDSAIPDAPLKATDEWAMLAFKRMARYAVDNGFDRIAWVTGEQAADLFDLSKRVNEINWRPSDSGTKRVGIDLQDANGLIFYVWPDGRLTGEASLEGKALDDVVGKEIADKIRGDDEGELRGDGLKVGGSGMRGFYDKILPAAVSKWGKKFGAKVGSTRIANDAGVGVQKWTVRFEDGSTHNSAWTDRRVAEQIANAALGDTVVPKGFTGSQQHAIDITPAMREAALSGQPLFSRESEGEAEGFFDPQTETVWLIADAISTPARARWVAYHEVTGHYGIRGVVDRIGKGAGSLRKAFAATRSNPTIDKLARAIAFDRGMADGELDIATEEAAAELSAAEETGDWQHLADRYGVTVPASMRPGIRGAIDRFVQSIKRLFSIIAEGRTDAFTDADWRGLVEGARRYVRTKPEPAAEQAAEPEPENFDVEIEFDVDVDGETVQATGNAQRMLDLAQKRIDNLTRLAECIAQ